jgi:PKD repeat protein
MLGMGENLFGISGRTRRSRMVLVSLRDFVHLLQLLGALLLLASPPPTFAVNVLTQHNDNFRTGANLNETILTVSNVSTNQFGKLFTRALDGQIYAQPLYVSGLTISNAIHNVVYVETEHNSVYAFDPDNPSPSNALWHVNLGASVPITDFSNCADLQPEVGITGTPVIDLTSGTMYVVAKTKVGSNHFQKLHALDILTGQEKFGGPVSIQGSVPGTGAGSSGGTLTFDPLYQHSRAGLLLLSNTVYVAFGSHCDYNNYHGWLFGYNATNLQQTAIFCTTPNAGVLASGDSIDGGGGIWGSGMGPAADTNGNIYVTTGNGPLDKNTGGLDLSDSLIKLSVSNGTLVVADWFSPHDQANMYTNDLDLGSGGPIVIPSANLLVLIGKTGVVYLINPQHLGGFVSFSSDTNIVQEFSAASTPYTIGQGPVYWNGPTNQFLYFWVGSTALQQFSFNGSTITTTPVALGNTPQPDRAGGISLSANGNTPGSGIIWGIEAGSRGTIHGYDASNVSHELWNSQQMPARDALGSYTKFCAPTIANGKVYVTTTSSNLVVYGLLGTPIRGVSPASYNFGSLTTGTTAQTSFVVTNTGGGTLVGTVATAGPFAIVSGGSYTVVGGGSSNVVVSFTPSIPGSFTNSVIFTSNGGISTNQVTGAGQTPPHLSINPGSLNFSTVATGTTAQATFVATNSGSALLSGTAVAGGAFTISSGSPYNVPGFGTANVVINFTPLSGGGFTTNVVFASNGGNSTNAVTGSGAAFPSALFGATPTSGAVPLAVTFTDDSTGTITNRFWSFGDGATSNLTLTTVAHTYSVAGTNTVRLIVSSPLGDNTNTQVNLIVAANPPQLLVSPTSQNFGTVVTGQSSNRLFSVINTGGLTLTGSATVVVGPYSVTAGSPFSAPPGQTQNVTVTFTPVAAGTFSTNLIVTSNGGASINALTGVGVTPAQLVVSPSSWNFGAITTGDVAYASFIATNSGGVALNGTASVGLPFSIVTNGSFNLAGFASTNVVVRFAPAIPGTWTSNVVFTSTGGSSTNQVSGVGLTSGSITVTPVMLNFGALATGTTAQASFVVTNTGGTAVSNGTAAVVGGGPFTIVSNATFSVLGLGSTNVVVRFAPVSAGGFTNSVVFTTANGGNATNIVTGAGAVAPVANFTAFPIGGTESLGVTFSDTSTGTQPLTLYWNLGDSILVTNSGGANFNHTYAAGIYTVALTASNAFGTSTLVSNNVIAVVTALQAWQLKYFGCTNCAQAQPNADPSGAGMSNTNRFLAGFDPTNPAAYLHIISIAATNSADVNVIYLGANGDSTWSPGIASRTNVLEVTAGTAGGNYSSNFASANVTNILSGGNGIGIVTNMIDSGGATNTPVRYYRVRVLVP